MAAAGGAVTLHTARLRLRAWQAADLGAFAALNADPRVMAHFPATLTRAESDALAGRIGEGLQRRGFGFWAVEAMADVPFIGFVGLSVPAFDAPFTPCVEIGWRLAFDHWGRGYAQEAARAALAQAFGPLGLEEVVAFTVPDNRRSRAVMERLGMRHDPVDDFEHPGLPLGHRLRRHVLYRLPRRDALAPPL